MSRESTKMVIPWPFASEANYLAGNYVERQTDGTPDKIFRRFNEMLGTRYSSNSFIGRSVYNLLLAGHNAVLSCIGDSTSDHDYNFIYQLAQKIAAEGLAKVVYHTFDRTTLYLSQAEVMQSTVPTAIEESGFDFNAGANGTLIISDDGTWTDPSIEIEFRVSDYSTSQSGVYVITKWDGSANRSFFIRLDGDVVTLAWFDGVIDHVVALPNTLAGTVPTDIVDIRVILTVDNGAGKHTIITRKSLDDGTTWSLVNFQDFVGTTTIVRDASVSYNINGYGDSQLDTLASDFKLHKATIRNCVDGEMCAIPINIEGWPLGPATGGAAVESTIPVLNIVNSSASGESSDWYDTPTLVKCTVPDANQTFIINHGHNDKWVGYDALHTTFSDLNTRIKAQVNNPKFIYSTQNPWSGDDFGLGRWKSTPLVGAAIRDFALINNFGVMDMMAAIPETITDWEALMEDSIHPSSTLPALLYGYMADYALHFITGR